MVTPIPTIELKSRTNSTEFPVLNESVTADSRNPAEIALEGLAYSLSDTSPDELFEGFEETRQSVFEKFYGASRGKD